MEELKDDLNPQFIYCLTFNALLSDIATGKIDPIELAKKELANRGYNENAEWVGFNKK